MFLRSKYSMTEADFKLVRGSNDIVIGLACLLIILSLIWIFRFNGEHKASFLCVMLSWIFSELFVRRQRMSSPAIILASLYTMGILFFSLTATADYFYGVSNNTLGAATSGSTGVSSLFLSRSVSTAAFYKHCIFGSVCSLVANVFYWLRFRVALSIAFLVGFTVANIMLIALFLGKNSEFYLIIMIFSGIIVFFIATYWDSSDIDRVTYRSDVGFWLHILSASLITHAGFIVLGFNNRAENVFVITAVIVFYLFVTLISIIFDRCVFMVASSYYFILTMATILSFIGLPISSMAVSGISVGVILLLLAVFWDQARSKVLIHLPLSIQRHVPKANRDKRTLEF